VHDWRDLDGNNDTDNLNGTANCSTTITKTAALVLAEKVSIRIEIEDNKVPFYKFVTAPCV
jgi:hypothetical protein